MTNDPMGYLHRAMGGKGGDGKVKVREHSRGTPKRAQGEMTPKRASAANIEGNESAKYEAMEKKSLKSLKGGGTEKELRAGHNQRKWIAGAIKHPGALHKQLGVPQGEKIPAKKMAAARAGKYGAKAEKRANFAKTLSGFKK